MRDDDVCALRMHEIVLIGQQGQVVCECCHLADRFLSRARGLLGFRRLSRGEGMLVRPTFAVHTFGVAFPVDVVYLDRKLTIVKITRGLRRWRISACRGAHSVLELSAGECDRLGITVGDRLGWGSPRSAA